MYNLHLLGWHNFQQLCHTVLTEVLGQTVESFLDSNDAGKDGAFSGVWKSKDQEDLSGQFVFQCKFTCKDNQTITASDLRDELPKATRLVSAGRCDVYIVLTNYGVSGESTETIKTLFLNIGVKQFKLYGSTWLVDKIKNNKSLRTNVPRLYGLGDLSQILDQRAYDQAESVLQFLRPELAKVVITTAYKRSLEALQKHNFVLLIGEPAAGKTTIAHMLAMAALDRWDCRILKMNDSTEMVKRWNPQETSRQFFWIDDAFGQTQYESSFAKAWNRDTLKINTLIEAGNQVVLTSRDYVFNKARQELKRGNLPMLSESQVVIDVRDLSSSEKRQIMYNHLKLGKQPANYKATIKPLLEEIALHPRFIPETARRLSDPIFTKKLHLSKHFISEFVEKQEQLMQEIIENLDDDSKAALALIYMRNDRLASPIDLNEIESRSLERMGSHLGGCIRSLEHLNDSLVSHFKEIDGSAYWKFKHPTIADAFSSVVRDNPELIEIYIQGANTDKLMAQISCGNVDIQNAVIVPPKFFAVILWKLNDYALSTNHKSRTSASWQAKWDILRFLASRCSKEFIEAYIAQHPGIWDELLNAGPMLEYKPEVSLLSKLFEVGLLPEEIRAKFVGKMIAYAVDGYDLFVIENKPIQQFLTEEEREFLDNRMKKEALSNLPELTRRWERHYPYEWEGVKNKMTPLISAMEALKKHFPSEISIKKAIKHQIKEIRGYIKANHVEPKRIPERTQLQNLDLYNFEGQRDFFEDVDN